jgi:fibronectin type 3 domain-containing protein
LYCGNFGWNRFFLSCLVLGLAMGCGVKAPPVVPHSPVPQTISDLTASSRRGMTVLQWSIPKKDADGKKLTDLGGFYLWRQVIPVAEIGCATCPADFRPLVEIDYQAPQNALRGTDRMTYWDYQVGQEGRYTYKVTAHTVHGVHSKHSNAAALHWLSPPPPPHHVEATPGDHVVLVSWEPTSRLHKGAGARGFNVYRRYPDRDYGLTSLNGSPISGNIFRDRSVTNDTTYYYVVRSLRSSEGAVIESKDSTEVATVPEDLTPPASPSATMAFQAHDGIVITWEPTLDPNLEGYRVYRRLETESIPTPISLRLVRKTMYLDSTFVPGLTYYYSVTAVDRSVRYNESDFSRELKVVTVTHTGE